MINIHYIRQKEPRGLGDDIVDSKVPCLKQLMNTYEEYRTTILGV